MTLGQIGFDDGQRSEPGGSPTLKTTLVSAHLVADIPLQELELQLVGGWALGRSRRETLLGLVARKISRGRLRSDPCPPGYETRPNGHRQQVGDERQGARTHVVVRPRR